MQTRVDVSIIVPVYNVENYLRECMESIIMQTLKNIQIIVVDDGSTDNCGIICDEYAKKDERIVVIHKKNGGLSSARNEGLRYVQGDYVGFVDSDDSIKLDMYEKLLNALKSSKSDLAFGYIQYQSGIIKSEQFNELKMLCNEEILNSYILGIPHPTLNKPVWNKLYRRDIIGDTRFIDNIHGEDGPFNLEILEKCTRCCYESQAVYNYRDNRDGSISVKGISERLFTDKLPSLLNQIAFLYSKDREELAKYRTYEFFKEVMVNYDKLEKNRTDINRNYQKRLSIIVQQQRKQLFQSFNYSFVNKKYIIKMLVFYICPRLYNLIKKLIKE